MSVRVTRTITIAVVFAFTAFVFVDPASAQLFKRHRQRGNNCCAPVTICCTSSHHRGRHGYGYGGSYGSFGGPQGVVYGQYPMNSSSYVTSWGTGTHVVNQNCCGASNVISQSYGTQGYNQGYNKGYDQSSGQTYSNQNSWDRDQGSTQTDYRNNSATIQDNQRNLNPNQQYRNDNGNFDSNRGINIQNDGTIRNDGGRNTDGSLRDNSDVNLDGTIRDRNSTNVEQRTDLNATGKREI